jgi:hypothetical protein
MEICVTKDEGSTQLVHVWRGSRYRPFAWRVERLLKVVLGPLTMVMFSYNSGWVTWCVGPYAKNIVFVVWRRLFDGCLGTRGPNMVGAWDCFPWCYHLDLLWLAAKLSLVGVMWRGYIATCTTYELYLTRVGIEPSDRRRPIPSHCIGRHGLWPPFLGMRGPRDGWYALVLTSWVPSGLYLS